MLKSTPGGSKKTVIKSAIGARIKTANTKTAIANVTSQFVNILLVAITFSLQGRGKLSNN